jgi:YVTN family beta-propeller protein
MSESKWPIIRNVGLAAVVFVVILSGVLYVSLNLSGSLSSTTTSSETASSTSSTVELVSTGSNSSESCIASVPVLISNEQNISTPDPFQQMLSIDSENYSQFINSNWSNVEFSTGTGCSGTTLQAWVEDNASSSSIQTIVWVDLESSVGAQSNTTIFMDFMSIPILSSSGPTGEAPQLSAIYGEYDNGALVFPFYDNFNGTSLSDKWQQGGNTAQSVGYIGSVVNDTPAKVDDGMVVHYNGTEFGGGQWDWVQSIQTFNPQTTVLDAYAYFNGLTNAATNQQIGWSAPGQNSTFEYAVSDGNLEYNGSNPVKNHYILLASPGTHTTLLNGVTNGYQVFSVWSDSVGRAYGLTNYVGLAVADGDWPSTSALIHFSEINGCPYSIYVQWTRVRALPPNGIMPSVSYGQIQNLPKIITAITARVIANITVGSEPKGAAYDPQNGLLYVADYSSMQVTVINVSTNNVVATINTGQEAWKPTYNPVNNMIYVGNDYTDNVTLINPSTNEVVSNISVCDYPVGTFFDPLNSLTYVLCDESNQVVALNSTNQIVAMINLPAGPGNGGYAITPSDQIYIAEYRGNNVSVIDGKTNTLTTTFDVGMGLGATAYDASDQLVYVAIAGNPDSPDNTTVLVNPDNNEVVGNIQIGSFPETLIFLPSFDTVVSANAFSNSLSFMNGTRIISTFSNVGSEPSGFAYDPSLQRLFVADLGTNSLVVVQVS